MFKIVMETEQGVQTVAAATAATASGAAVLISTAQEVASAVFGVPLPVVLAAAIGAFGAQSLMPKTSYMGALVVCIFWTLIGTACAQLALWIVTFWISKEMPPGAMTGAALLVAGGGRFLLTHDILERVRAALGRLVDNIGKKHGNDDAK